MLNWFICLTLLQYHTAWTVWISVAVPYVLKSHSVTPLILFFFVNVFVDILAYVLPKFSSRSFMLSLSHFEFTLVQGVKVCSSFTDCTWSCPVFPAPLFEETFSHFIFSLLCQILIDCRCVGLFLSSLVCSIGPYICFYINTHYFDYRRLVVLSKVYKVMPPVPHPLGLLWQLCVFCSFIQVFALFVLVLWKMSWVIS